jgi:hypothetical protein
MNLRIYAAASPDFWLEVSLRDFVEHVLLPPNRCMPTGRHPTCCGSWAATGSGQLLFAPPLLWGSAVIVKADSQHKADYCLGGSMWVTHAGSSTRRLAMVSGFQCCSATCGWRGAA